MRWEVNVRMASRINGKLSATSLENLKRLLLARRAVVCGDADTLELETNGGNGELSSVPFHMADVGSENYEREFSLGILENEEQEIREIDEALSRIEKGTFGICESCDKAIPVARLKALPYARMCVECKQNEENGLG